MGQQSEAEAIVQVREDESMGKTEDSKDWAE